MDARFPARLIFLAALITVITLSSVALVFYINYRESLRLESLNAQLQSYSSDILLYNEQLSSAALLAAHSGDTVWIDRYMSIEPHVIESIESALELADSEALYQAAKLTDEANMALVSIENEAFSRILMGQKNTAQMLLSDENYRNQKKLYSNGMEAFAGLIKKQRMEELDKQKRRVEVLLWTVPLSLVLSIVLWAMVYRALRKWQARFAEEERLRSEAEAQVRSLNGDLENRIEERTSELEESKNLLSYQANHDELTGLPNRRFVLNYLQEKLVCLTENEKMSVLLIDLDHFKLVNDTLGHAAGDELLQQAADRLKLELEGRGIVARLGGDEFLLVADHTDSDGQDGEKMALANSILERFTHPFYFSGHRYDLPISPSIGIAMAPEDGIDAEEIMRNADTAMYAAKETGRNNACVFKSEMTVLTKERVAMEGKLRSAIHSDSQFQLHYQPQVSLASNEVVGVEALLRWIQPEDGMIPPDKFIPIAEDTGLILEIGQWVLFEAARQMREWRDNHNIEFDVSINVASQELKQADFGDKVRKVFMEHGTSANHFGIEITESSLIGNDTVSTSNISSLNKMGVKLSMDDFGTGYSALSYLKQYPFDVLKIDRSFIASILEIESDAALVEGIINMSRNINLKVVGEGTENLEQCDLLRKFGCDIAQGYYFSKPLPASELITFLAERDNLAAYDEQLRKAS